MCLNESLRHASQRQLCGAPTAQRVRADAFLANACVAAALLQVGVESAVGEREGMSRTLLI